MSNLASPWASMAQFDTCVWRYFTCGVKLPVSSGVFSPAFGDDEIISKNSETINNPAIPAPINIRPLLSFFPFALCCLLNLMHAAFHVHLSSFGFRRASLSQFSPTSPVHCIALPLSFTIGWMQRMSVRLINLL
jgi:hypothetical protein